MEDPSTLFLFLLLAAAPPLEDRIVALQQHWAAEFEKSYPTLDDAVANGYVEKLGRQLVSPSGSARPFSFRVAQSYEKFASSLPGGAVAIISAMLAGTNSEQELAAILSHQIAHLLDPAASSRQWLDYLSGLCFRKSSMLTPRGLDRETIEQEASRRAATLLAAWLASGSSSASEFDTVRARLGSTTRSRPPTLR